eukprot:4358141-Pleurochrysis_carterae.AAC.1
MCEHGAGHCTSHCCSDADTSAGLIVDSSGRVDYNLEARMNEQSALIASLAQGMHEMPQQMKQLRLDTAAAASAPRP